MPIAFKAIVDFLSSDAIEGFSLIPVVPSDDSGVTYGIGIDLNQQTAKSLRAAGVDDAIIKKLQSDKLFGIKGAKARKAIAEIKSPLDEAEALSLSTKVIHQTTAQIEKKFNADSDLIFGELAPEVQSTIVSIAHQFGTDPKKSYPKFWNAAIENDARLMAAELRQFSPADESGEIPFQTRRFAEAKNIEPFVEGQELAPIPAPEFPGDAVVEEERTAPIAPISELTSIPGELVASASPIPGPRPSAARSASAKLFDNRTEEETAEIIDMLFRAREHGQLDELLGPESGGLMRRAIDSGFLQQKSLAPPVPAVADEALAFDEAAVGLPEEVATAPGIATTLAPAQTAIEAIRAGISERLGDVPLPEPLPDVDVSTPSFPGAEELAAQEGIELPTALKAAALVPLGVAGGAIAELRGEKEEVLAPDADIIPQVVFRGGKSPMAQAISLEQHFLPFGEALTTLEEAIPGETTPGIAGTGAPELGLGRVEVDVEAFLSPTSIETRGTVGDLFLGIVSDTALINLALTPARGVMPLAQFFKPGERFSIAGEGTYRMIQHLDDGVLVRVEAIRTGVRHPSGKLVKKGHVRKITTEVLEAARDARRVKMKSYRPNQATIGEKLKIGDEITIEGKRRVIVGESTMRLKDPKVVFRSEYLVEDIRPIGAAKAKFQEFVSKDAAQRMRDGQMIELVAPQGGVEDLRILERQMSIGLKALRGEIKSPHTVAAHARAEAKLDVPFETLGDEADTILRVPPEGIRARWNEAKRAMEIPGTEAPFEPGFMTKDELIEVLQGVEARFVKTSKRSKGFFGQQAIGKQILSGGFDIPAERITWRAFATDLIETTTGQKASKSMIDKVEVLMRSEAGTVAGVEQAKLILRSDFAPTFYEMLRIQERTGIPVYDRLYVPARNNLNAMRKESEMIELEFEQIFDTGFTGLLGKNSDKAFEAKKGMSDFLEAATPKAKLAIGKRIGGINVGRAQKARLWFDRMFQRSADSDVVAMDPKFYIENYVSRIRSPAQMDEIARELGGQGLPKDLIAFFTKERIAESRVQFGERDIEVLMRLYKTAYLRQKYLAPWLEEAKAVVGEIQSPQVKEFMVDYMNTVMGRATTGELNAQKYAQRLTRGIHAFAGTKATARLERAMERGLVTRKMANQMYKIFLGYSPGSAIKNQTQKLLTNMVVGERWTFPAFSKYSKIGPGRRSQSADDMFKLVDDSGILGRFADFALDNRALGWFSFADVDNRVVTIGATLDKHEHFGRLLMQGKISRTKFIKKVDLDFVNPIERAKIMQKVDEGRILTRRADGAIDYDSASWLHADYNQLVTQFPYEAGGSPRVFRGGRTSFGAIVKPAFGVFQSWWLNYMHVLGQVAKRPGTAKKLARLIGWGYATEKSAEYILGIDVSDWVIAGPLPGSPFGAPGGTAVGDLYTVVRNSAKATYGDASEFETIETQKALKALKDNPMTTPVTGSRAIRSVLKALHGFGTGELDLHGTIITGLGLRPAE